MATSTYMTFLMHQKTPAAEGTEAVWEKLIDITEFPDLGTDPEMLETTTLSDRMQTFIMGIQGNEAMTFNTNYEKAGFSALKALRNKVEQYGVWFGGTENDDGTVTPTGDEGKFNFPGQLNVRVTGGGVNEVRGMAITIAPTGVIVEE
nr:MAG TPA: Major tail protein [Caudoviricetes sp.]